MSAGWRELQKGIARCIRTDVEAFDRFEVVEVGHDGELHCRADVESEGAVCGDILPFQWIAPVELG